MFHSENMQTNTNKLQIKAQKGKEEDNKQQLCKQLAQTWQFIILLLIISLKQAFLTCFSGRFSVCICYCMNDVLFPALIWGFVCLVTLICLSLMSRWRSLTDVALQTLHLMRSSYLSQYKEPLNKEVHREVLKMLCVIHNKKKKKRCDLATTHTRCTNLQMGFFLVSHFFKFFCPS